MAQRVFGSANLEENFDVFLWLLDRDGLARCLSRNCVTRARAAGLFYRIGNISAAVSKCKLCWLRHTSNKSRCFSSQVSDLLIAETGSSILTVASLNVSASADWSFSPCVDTRLHEGRVYKENSLVLIGNDNRLIQNFENTSICVSHSRFSVTRDDDRSFMKV